MSDARLPWKLITVVAAVATVALLGGYALGSVLTVHASVTQSSNVITGTEGPVQNFEIGTSVTLAPGFNPSGSCANNGTLYGNASTAPANQTFTVALTGECQPYDFTENFTIPTAGTLEAAVDTFLVFAIYQIGTGISGESKDVVTIVQHAASFLLGVNTSAGTVGGSFVTISIDFGTAEVPQEITNLQVLISEQLAPSGQLPGGWNLIPTSDS